MYNSDAVHADYKPKKIVNEYHIKVLLAHFSLLLAH